MFCFRLPLEPVSRNYAHKRAKPACSHKHIFWNNTATMTASSMYLLNGGMIVAVILDPTVLGPDLPNLPTTPKAVWVEQLETLSLYNPDKLKQQTQKPQSNC